MSQEFACPRCSVRYDSEHDLDLHLLCVHKCTYPGCQMLLKDRDELPSHLREVHGVEERWGVEIEIPEPGFHPLSEPPAPPQAPSRIEDLYKWLWKICLLMAEARRPEIALDHIQQELAPQAAFVKQHFNRISQAIQLSRYTRLKTPEAKASYLVVVLAHRQYKPAYALQRTKPGDVLALVRD